MPDRHGHGHNHGGGCCSEAHDDDDHVKPGEGDQVHLFSKIDDQRVEVLNAIDESQAPKIVTKPWHMRYDETHFIQSDVDSQLILHIPFTESVRLRCLLLKMGPSNQTPTSISIFKNQSLYDFDTLNQITPTLILNSIPSTTKEVIEFPLRIAKFSNTDSITLFITDSVDHESCRISFVAFKGDELTWNSKNQVPVNLIYEASPNVLDHKKVESNQIGSQFTH